MTNRKLIWERHGLINQSTQPSLLKSENTAHRLNPAPCRTLAAWSIGGGKRQVLLGFQI